MSARTKLSDYVKLNRPYSLRMENAPTPLVTLQYGFKPPVNVVQDGRVTVTSDSWRVDLPSDSSGSAGVESFDGKVKALASETLVVFAGPEAGFVVTSVSKAVSLKHVPKAAPSSSSSKRRATDPNKQAFDALTRPKRAKVSASKAATSAATTAAVTAEVTAAVTAAAAAAAVGESDEDWRWMLEEEEEEEEEGEEEEKKEEGVEEEEEEEGGGEEEDITCGSCGAGHDAEELLLCDGKGCEMAFHTYCLVPALARAPEGDWYCPKCSKLVDS